MKIINNVIIIFLITVRPLLGPSCCKFPISCTQYALLQLKEKPFFRALYYISKRLIFCCPFMPLPHEE